MKNGHPSLIYDIRYFYGNTTTYLDGHHDITAYGRRLAWFLNAEELSIGAYHSLYVLFSKEIKTGEIKVTDEGFDWWQRYTYVGVPEGFPALPNSAELAIQGTLLALKAICPDCAQKIDKADKIVRSHREKLRFLIKSKSYKNFTVIISVTIPEHPEQAGLYISLINKKTDEVLEAEPVYLNIYNIGFDLAGLISLTDDEVVLSPQNSLTGKILSMQYNAPIRKRLENFYTAKKDIFFSKLVKRPKF